MDIIAKGIDVSVYQGDIDWEKVKASGIQFAILKCSWGEKIADNFEKNYAAAKAVGMPVGAYCYSYAKSVEGAKKEAEAAIKILKGKTFEYPIAFDLEDNSQLGLSKDILTNMCKAFCDTLEAAGYYPAIYSYKSWLTDKLNMTALKKYDVWLAQYNNVVTYKGTYTVWQYSSKGKVDGIKGNVDMDYAYVDYPKYIKSKHLNGFKEQSSNQSSGKTGSSSGNSGKTTTTKFKKGDVVKITGSKYYNGLNIPSWVKAKNWIVESVSGDKVIINKSTDGANKIMSPINAKDIALVMNSTSSSSSKPTTTTNTIKKGCVVKITGKKYYDGQKIPLWVRLKQWVVYSISGNRVVIDKDVSGKYSIMSAVNKNDLKFIRKSK